MQTFRLLPAALALTLLSGCSVPPAGESASPSAATAVTTTETATAAGADDMAYLSADIRRDHELLTVDGQPITAEEYLFWLVNAIEVRKQLGYLADDTAWEETLDGVDTAEALKNDALDTALFYRVIRTKAEAAGITLSENDKMEIETQLATDQARTGGPVAFQIWLDANCISQEAYTRMYEVYYLNRGLEKTVEGVEEFLEEQGIYAAKHILLSTRRLTGDGVSGSYEAYTEEEKAEVLARLTQMRKEILAAEDVEAAFDAKMNEYSEDSRDENGDLFSPEGYSYLFPSQMTPEFEAGAKALNIGEVSEPIETEMGYHLILRIAVDDNQARTARQSALTEEWIAQAEVVPTKAYEELDPKMFYDRLTSIVDAKEAAANSADAGPVG